MQILKQKIEHYLIELTWSLWTELGVLGISRHHHDCLIAPEELILLTTLIAELDPRLRDEALDWCSQYHHFISVTRLKALIKVCGPCMHLPFSIFAATLNTASTANWPLFTKTSIKTFIPSRKSKAPQCKLPALLYLRLRGLFGTGARADLLTFFLTSKESNFTAADTAQLGYNKRSLSDLLESFVQSGLFDVLSIRNQLFYRFTKKNEMIQLLGKIPKTTPSWRLILEIILPLWYCIQSIENKSIATKITQIRGVLLEIDEQLKLLQLEAPPFQADFNAYLHSFSNWLLSLLENIAHGDFSKKI
ncbi:MAG: hypothetical protein WCG10_00125 [Chlamydiota bacterium]